MNSLVGNRVAFAAPVLQRQVLHREVDALQLAAGHRQIARLPGAAGEQHGVEVGDADARRHVDADVDARPEHHAFGLHDRQPAIEEALLHLELGNAVAQQAADAIGLLEDGHRVAGAIQLIGGGQARRARADDRDLLPGARRRAAAA